MTALFEAFLRISLVFVAALVGVVNAEACRSQCYIQQHPKCGIDLEDSSVEANEGIYQVSCEICERRHTGIATMKARVVEHAAVETHTYSEYSLHLHPAIP